jgi:hypothetical protein
MSDRRIRHRSLWGGLLLVWSVVAVAWFSTAFAYQEGAAPYSGRTPTQGIVRFKGIYHNVNKLLLHASNMGFFGSWNADTGVPSGEWPAGSGIEWLFAAGLWVGGVKYDSNRRPDTLVTASVYQLEFYPKPDARDIVYTTSEGAPGGGRLQDDDGDGLYDEDPLDGYDNDRDGLVDEDFAAISQQMFTAVFYDTMTSMNKSRTRDFHVPLQLMSRQESYAWTSQALENFIGVEYRTTNIGDSTIYKAYVAFMVDSDIGDVRHYPQAYADDMAGYIDTTVTRKELDPGGAEVDVRYHLTIGYMYDFPGGQDGTVLGYFGTMFMGHTTDPSGKRAPQEVGIHMFKQWSSGEEDPESDRERYRYMKGNSDNEKTIDPPSVKAADYRFLVSAGPFAELAPDSTLTIQVAFVAGSSFNDFLENATNAQKVYNGGPMSGPGGQQVPVHWLGSSPPPPPKQQLIAGDSRVIIEWDDYSETTPDPLQRVYDFAGYRIWKAVGWKHQSSVPSTDQWRLIGHFSKEDLPRIDTGLMGIGKYRFEDDDVHNGLPYWYAVTAFDDGSAEKIRNQSTGAIDSIPRYGSYSQSMQIVYPRGTPETVKKKVTIVPNPYPGMDHDARITGRAIGDMVEYEGDPSGRRIRFLNLPRQATVRIFSLSGDLVWSEYFDNPLNPVGEPPGWNLVSRNNQEIVSGTYIVHVESPLGNEVTRLVVVR